MFLPDRYIKGECPKCGAKDQYGDACESCGVVQLADRSAESLLDRVGRDPRAQVVGPFLLPALRSGLRRVPAGDGRRRPGRLQPEVANKALEWLGDSTPRAARGSPTGTSRAMRRTSASRSPTRRASTSTSGSTRRSATSRASRRTSRSRASISPRSCKAPTSTSTTSSARTSSTSTRCSGPRCSKFAGAPYKVPDNVFVHGFITASGEKMSKSRGTGVSPDVYLDLGLDPEWLRYYIAAKLNAKVEDIDFNPDDFIARVNSDLIGKYVNIASRAATFITKYFDGKLSPPATEDDDLTPRTGIDHGRLGIRSGNRGRLRGARVRQGAARGDADRRSHQRALRPGEAVGARQGSVAARRAAGRVHRRAQCISRADVLPRARAAGARGQGRADARHAPAAALG